MVYLKPGSVEVQKIDFPTFRNPAGKTIDHGVILKVVTTNICGSDQHMVRGWGKPAYVWVLTNLFDVAYLYTESREGAFLQEMLKDFRGVLVSDFYTAYDAMNCAQQKCLIHLIRDLNDDVLKHPFDEELKGIVRSFAALLKPIIQTIDHRGLKQRFLAKHRIEVDRFYRELAKQDYQSERAKKCKKRFEKYRDKLFIFLSYDGVPWNNNNAEHAVKAFAKIRDIVRGTFTARTARNNLVLLSILSLWRGDGGEETEVVLLFSPSSTSRPELALGAVTVEYEVGRWGTGKQLSDFFNSPAHFTCKRRYPYNRAWMRVPMNNFSMGNIAAYNCRKRYCVKSDEQLIILGQLIGERESKGNKLGCLSATCWDPLHSVKPNFKNIGVSFDVKGKLPFSRSYVFKLNGDHVLFWRGFSHQPLKRARSIPFIPNMNPFGI
jgi:hypothetical protein